MSEVETLRKEVEALRHDIERHQKIAAELATENEALREKAERFQKLDAEAATHIETVICMRTHFTGEPSYVGWQGLGLALREALDERDRLREENERMKRVIGRESINVGAATRYLAVTTPSEETVREARRMLDEVEVALGGAYVAGKGGVNG